MELPFTELRRLCSPAGIYVLSYLAVIEQVGEGRCASEIARELNLSPASVSSILDLLEMGTGAVMKMHNNEKGTNRRKNTLKLTEVGEQLLTKANSLFK